MDHQKGAKHTYSAGGCSGDVDAIAIWTIDSMGRLESKKCKGESRERVAERKHAERNSPETWKKRVRNLEQ
jgi:hypothetical protein